MKYDEIIKTHYKELQKLSDEEIYDVVTEVIKHYREVGFPYFEIDHNRIAKEFNNLQNLNPRDLELKDNELQQSMVGLATCNMFHPEMYSVKCNNSKSPTEIFEDDELFRTALTKRIKYNDRYLTPSCVRRSLTAFGGQGVSNFRPSIAKWVYRKFGSGGSVVLDPCAGYGGRLLGAMTSEIKEYIGFDPNKVSIEGNMKLYHALDRANKYRMGTKVTLLAEPFEDSNINKKFDIVFTSPPYFDKEKYSNDDTQSWVRYKTYDSWVRGFLQPLIEKSYELLDTGGYLILNVGDPIIDTTKFIGSWVFSKNPLVYKMRLSKFLGKGDKEQISHKLEPIFIWRKNVRKTKKI